MSYLATIHASDPDSTTLCALHPVHTEREETVEFRRVGVGGVNEA